MGNKVQYEAIQLLQQCGAHYELPEGKELQMRSAPPAGNPPATAEQSPGQPRPTPLFASQKEFSHATTILMRRLYEVAERAEKIEVWNPLCFSALSALKSELTETENEYFRCIEYSYVRLCSKTADASVGAVVYGQHILAESLPYFLRLESVWSRAQQTIDYKRAYALAMLALYISISSGIVSLVGVFLSLR